MLLEKLTVRYDRDETELIINGENFIITINDMHSLSLSSNSEGTFLSEELYSNVLSLDEKLRCMKKALAAVARTSSSRRQLFLKLKREFNADAINACLDKLEKIGYLNDTELAKRYAELYAKKRFGKTRISTELFKKGFGREDINTAIECLTLPEDEMFENISSLLEKKFRSKAFDKNKAYAYLRGMGYDSGEIKSALERICEEMSDDSEDLGSLID